MLPYEEISEEQYNSRKVLMKKFNPELLRKYEIREEEFDIGDDGCDTGACPVR